MIKRFLSSKKEKMPKTKTNEELMKNYHQLLQFAQSAIESADIQLKRAKLTLDQLASFDPENPESLLAYLEEVRATNPEELKVYKAEEGEVIEGVFDGYYMVGADHKKYPVPVNYSSKSKLVPGDVMKLKILNDGKLLFKLIRPVERKHLKATLMRTDDNKYTANTDNGKIFFLNQAAVSFYSGTPGDELYIVVNAQEEGAFAAIEAIIKQ